jgi:hypothetical protein
MRKNNQAASVHALTARVKQEQVQLNCSPRREGKRDREGRSDRAFLELVAMLGALQ